MKKEEEVLQRGRYVRRDYFDPELRATLIKEIASGVPRSVIRKKAGPAKRKKGSKKRKRVLNMEN